MNVTELAISGPLLLAALVALLAGAISFGGTQVGPTAARGLLLVLAYCLGLGLPS